MIKDDCKKFVPIFIRFFPLEGSLCFVPFPVNCKRDSNRPGCFVTCLDTPTSVYALIIKKTSRNLFVMDFKIGSNKMNSHCICTGFFLHESLLGVVGNRLTTHYYFVSIFRNKCLVHYFSYI